MVNFWVSLLFLLISWGFALLNYGISTQIILYSAIFFGLYFIVPIVNRTLSQLIYIILPLLIILMFQGAGTNEFVWIIFVALALQATSVFEDVKLYLYMFYLYVLGILSSVFQSDWRTVAYLTLLVLLVGTLYFQLRKAVKNEQVLAEENNKLQDEFKQLKRQLVSGEEMVRQEERNQIAREIHDSVGHRLTALVMQAETARIQAADEEEKEKFQEIKKLAQSSLYETREAVKTLKSEETSGIQAIIQLIRKMEAESQLRLSITLKSGVLGTIFSNRQSVVIYRAVQEALTNMMRHSNSRQANIEFEIVAQRDFRFRVIHPLKEEVYIKEGFGLTNMRERLDELGGKLMIEQTNHEFHIIGQFPLEVKDYE